MKKWKRVIDNVYIFGMYILRLFIRMIPVSRQNEKEINILVSSYFNLGDIICDSPSFKAIKKKWPNAKIHVLVRRPVGVLLMEECPYVNSTEVVTSENDGIIRYIKQLIRLKRMGFNYSFQLVRPFDQVRKTYISFLLDVPNRYGLVDKRKEHLFRRCFTKYDYVYRKTSRKQESIKVVKLAGIDNIDETTECWIPSKAETSIKEKFNIEHLKNEYIIVHPGASLEFKCWPAEKYIKFIDDISERYDLKVVLTGTKSEDSLLNQINEGTKSDLIVLNDLTIFELFVLIKNSRVVVTNDTGPLHFSIALKKNVISIFGPTFPDYAIGCDILDNCVVIRGTTKHCNKDECAVYRNMPSRRKKQICNLCDNNQIVCTDMITTEIVEYFFQQLLVLEPMGKIVPSNNFQGFNPWKFAKSSDAKNVI